MRTIFSYDLPAFAHAEPTAIYGAMRQLDFAPRAIASAPWTICGWNCQPYLMRNGWELITANTAYRFSQINLWQRLPLGGLMGRD